MAPELVALIMWMLSIKTAGLLISCTFRDFLYLSG